MPVSKFKSVEFKAGMKHATERLYDPPPTRWDPKFQRALHAMVLLAHDSVPKLFQALDFLRTQVRAFADVSTELGIQLYNEHGLGIEHFGFRDGISQPLFFRVDLKENSRRTGCDDHAHRWNPAAGPNLVVIRDPLVRSDADCGTYYVFRKLEQNVKGFRKRLEKLADKLHLVGVDRQLAGALVIGRFPNGTPVALRKHSDAQWKSPANHFLYPKVDKYGTRCPFFAHIRKANPRGDDLGSTLCDQIKHRIARRGIPYGHPAWVANDLDACPESGVGLLFQSCQADLGSQFETLQQGWANNNQRTTGERYTGRDPLIGQSKNGYFPELKFTKAWGQPGDRIGFSFHDFVTLKGGEYFFVPSISFLRTLK